MTIENAIQSVFDDLRLEAATDIVGLWLVQSWVQQAAPQLDVIQTKTATLSIVRQAMERGDIIAGGFVDGNFEVWDTTPDYVIRRLEGLWPDPNKELTINDNVWFGSRYLDYRTLG